MVLGYWSVAILFWQLSIDHIVNVLKSYIKDVDLPRHAWDTPPFLLIVFPTPPVQSVDAYVRTYTRSITWQPNEKRLTIFNEYGALSRYNSLRAGWKPDVFSASPPSTITSGCKSSVMLPLSILKRQLILLLVPSCSLTIPHILA